MKRTLQGTVIKNKMDKTIVVRVEGIKQHSKYLRRYKTQKKYKVHDEKKEAKIGDKVVFEETRPLSKEKRWRLIEILNSKL